MCIIAVHNIDGTLNKAGSITHYTRLGLVIDQRETWTDFLVTELGEEDLILGLPWLRKVNPHIDWIKETLSTTPETIHATATSTPSDTLPTTPPLYRFNVSRKTRRAWIKAGILVEPTEEVWCAAGYTSSQQIAEKVSKSKPAKTFEETVPPQYRDFEKVFSEAESTRLPVHQPWDHAIELTPGAPQTMKTKVYLMALNEQEELDRFLKESQQKGYIRPSKSPLSSPSSLSRKRMGSSD